MQVMQKLENQKSESLSKEGNAGMVEEAVQTGPGEARAFMGLNHAIENRYILTTISCFRLGSALI
jgi:hypothetical protein